MYMFSECLSLGQCIPLGTKWLNTDICLEKKCGKSVDEYGTELHIVERTKGNYILGYTKQNICHIYCW